MAMPSNWNAIVRHRFIAFNDHIRFDVRVLRARYLITLTRDETTVEAHFRRTGDHLAAVVGIVTDTNEIHHE